MHGTHEKAHNSTAAYASKADAYGLSKRSPNAGNVKPDHASIEQNPLLLPGGALRSREMTIRKVRSLHSILLTKGPSPNLPGRIEENLSSFRNAYPGMARTFPLSRLQHGTW